MGFKFSYVCDLLSQLDSNRVLKATTAARKIDPDTSTVIAWFKRHSKLIHDGRTDRLALLSCLFPKKRPDRVYNLREASLVKVIGRCLLLGTSRKQELDLWRTRGRGDLGQCVENVMRQAENHIKSSQEVTVQEVDLALAQIASKCRFSGPSIQRSYSAVSVDDALAPIFRRLSSRDAKWLTRLILKDYSPVEVPEKLVLRKFHFMMPTLLTFQDSMEAALRMLSREPIASFPANPSPDYAEYLMRNVMAHLPPQLGVKIGRPDFHKARGLKHCCTLARKRMMSLEKKYDGEYCQIHVDLSRGNNCIQIFSKSGKDSTQDRIGVHQAIKECLRIGKPDCQVKRQCILEGELLVWGVQEGAILPFYKLRKHVSRSGSFLGADNDSPPNPNERLYIVYFDILLLDDDICLSKSYTDRRNILSQVVNPVGGVGALSDQETVNFARPDAFERLKSIFSMVAAQRWEGLVLKGCDEPYFTLKQYTPGDHSGHWIKMKKEYIAGLGDTADFAIIGARYDSGDAANLQAVKPLFWTSFYVGCLENPAAAAGSAQPVFRVVDILSRDSMTPQIIQFLNQYGQFHARDSGSESLPFTLKIDQTQLPKVEVIFRKPFVVELTGFGFERPPNVRYFTLRFPRVIKVHLERTFREATSFEELQQLAEAARSVPDEELTQEMAIWAEKLDPKGEKSEDIVDCSEESLQSTYAHSHSHGSVSVEDWVSPAKDTVAVAQRPSQHGGNAQSPVRIEKKRVFAIDDTPERPSKRKLSQSTSFIVLEDSSPPSSPSPEESPPAQAEASGRLLTDLSNVPSIRSQQSHTSESAVSSHTSVLQEQRIRATDIPQDNQENLTYTGSSSKIQISQSSRVKSHSQTDAVNRTVAATTTEVQIRDVAVDRSKPFFSNIPILTGSTVSQKTGSVQRYLAEAKAMATTSSVEFLDLLSGSNRVRKMEKSAAAEQEVQILRTDLKATSSKETTTNHASVTSSTVLETTPPEHGIGLVLVESHGSDEASSCAIADEIIQIGNAMTSHFRNGKLSGTGKVLFLHWEILRYAALFGKERTEELDDRVKRLFAACLKWGKDVAPCQRRESLVEGKEKSASRGGCETKHVVAASWEWEDALSLFCENG